MIFLSWPGFDISFLMLSKMAIKFLKFSEISNNLRKKFFRTSKIWGEKLIDSVVGFGKPELFSNPRNESWSGMDEHDECIERTLVLNRTWTNTDFFFRVSNTNEHSCIFIPDPGRLKSFKPSKSSMIELLLWNIKSVLRTALTVLKHKSKDRARELVEIVAGHTYETSNRIKMKSSDFILI